MTQKDDLVPDPSIENGPWRQEHVWVSQHNFAPELMKTRKMPAEVIIHDSTLRDGEQAPGINLDTDDKVRIARMLDEVGIQYIEAGFPPVSQQDRNSIKAICKLGLKAKITCLCRAMRSDIDMSADCGVWGLVMEVPVGYPRLMYQFEWPEQKLYDRVMDSITYAKKEKGLGVCLFLIDTARARMGFLERLLKDAAATGSLDRIAVVDTVGAIVPEASTWMTQKIRSWVDLPLEMHCHNDLGLGVANTVAGLMAGAQIASTTVGGLGQRAGNAPTEEVIMALKVGYGVPCSLKTEKLVELSKLVQELTGYRHPAYRPIVGDNVFRWAAGIPVAALLKEPRTVEAFGPELLGQKHQIEIGKKAGKANITWKIDTLGLAKLPDDKVDELLQLVKEKATEIKSALNDEEFISLYQSVSK
jgi:methanogen homocitrate synthase